MQATAVPETTRRLHYSLPERLALDRGGLLPEVTLAYETWGELSPARDNAVLVLHALTGDSHAADLDRPDDPRAAWWNPLIGPGLAFDTERFYVVCSNTLGGCAGSTGPLSIDPATGRRFELDFPVVTILDMVRAQRELVRGLGIRRLAAVTGGSIGGMQALEWAVRYPELVERALLFGATGRIGPQAIGFNAIGRAAITLDPAWRGGRYEPGDGPSAGLAIARMIGMMTYQSPEGQWRRFGRAPAARSVTGAGSPRLFEPPFDIEGYLEYQGRALVRRFDANAYLYLTRAMDLYDVAEGWADEAAALRRVRARTLHVGISSDWLYPPGEVRALAETLRALGSAARYAEIESPHGHDAFLKEWDAMARIITDYLEE